MLYRVVASPARSPNLPPDGQGLPVVVQGLLPLSEPVVRATDVVEGGGFAGSVPNLPPDGQRLPVVAQGLLPIPQPVIRATDVAGRRPGTPHWVDPR